MDNKQIDNIELLIKELEKADTSKIKSVMGLDGFVDTILHVVNVRKNANEYIRLNTLKEFGERISNAAGLSTNIEMIPIKSKLGGNGPIMSNALSSYGLDVTYIGALGVPAINPVFQSMAEKCNLISIANPGLTDAVECLDGKILIGKRECLKDVNWVNIKSIVGLDNLVRIIKESKLIGLENWTMLTNMTDIWRGIIDEILPQIEEGESKKYIFFDLADPEGRLKKDVLEALDVIKEFSSKFNVILGLNKKEAGEIAEILGVANSKDDLKTLNTKIAEDLGIYCVVVHPIVEASAVCNGVYSYALGPYVAVPKLTTGAGDNFNAGFCLGQVLGLSAELSVILAVATSGYYVKNAESPTLETIIEFLKEWKNTSK